MTLGAKLKEPNYMVWGFNSVYSVIKHKKLNKKKNTKINKFTKNLDLKSN